MASLHSQLKRKKLSGIFIWKLTAASFQNTLELYYEQQICLRNSWVNLDGAFLLPLKNALCILFADNNKKLFTIKKKSITIPNDLHHWKHMNKIFLPGFWVSTHFYMWPPYYNHIFQGLLIYSSKLRG